jgi:hypothetical protein
LNPGRRRGKPATNRLSYGAASDEEIINNVLEDGNSENEQESTTPPIILTIRHDDAMSAFTKCYKWAEENSVQAGDILAV